MDSVMTNAGSHMSKRKVVYWWVGPATGAIVSAIVTVIVVIWEWIENPGGIFRSQCGTNWQFVLDTAVSWIVPTFVYVTLIASTLLIAWHFVKRYRGR